MKSIGSYPSVRLRRNRKTEWSRRLVRENHLSTNDLIWPIFIREGKNIKEPIKSMPGVFRYTLDKIEKLVERAIDKSEINQTINFENLRYEGFGPEKIAVIVETLTDNKNRTASNIRTIFQKHGGNLGTLGSASHNFNQLGVIRIDNKEASDEEILEIAVEAGADECVSNDDIHQIFCSKENLYKVKNIIERKVSNFIFTGIEWIPLNKIDIVKEKIDSMINFIEALEEDDDVQNIYTNFKEKNFN